MVDAAFATDEQKRLALALRIKNLDSIKIPTLDAWNYAPCEHHKVPRPDCLYRKCGGELFAHQKTGAAWLYVVQHGTLADDPGVGKTNEVLALMALLKQRHELGKRALIIPNTPATRQWYAEMSRWVPGISAIAVDGSMTKEQRQFLYTTDWECLIVGVHTLLKDQDILKRLMPFDLVVNDDVDALLNHKNAMHKAIRDISIGATRTFTVNATIIQTQLEQLHAAYVPCNGYELLGSLPRFQRRYKYVEDEYEMVQGRYEKRRVVKWKNLPELKTKLAPVYMRRRADELKDVRMPMLMPPVFEWFDLSEAQRELYEELRKGVITLMREEGTKIKHVTALTKFMYGQQICAGLPALNMPDGPGASPKLDKLFHNLETVWTDNKVIVFMKNIGMVKATLQRAAAHNIGVAVIWGNKQNAEQREEQRMKFWDDPTCRLCVGTTAIERSLNLQVANTVVALDTHLNPARMKQILGRSKRAGSPLDRVFMFTYLTRNTQEEKYLLRLGERQALADELHEEESEMYRRFSGMDLLEMMTA